MSTREPSLRRLAREVIASHAEVTAPAASGSLAGRSCSRRCPRARVRGPPATEGNSRSGITRSAHSPDRRRGGGGTVSRRSLERALVVRVLRERAVGVVDRPAGHGVPVVLVGDQRLAELAVAAVGLDPPVAVVAVLVATGELLALRPTRRRTAAPWAPATRRLGGVARGGDVVGAARRRVGAGRGRLPTRPGSRRGGRRRSRRRRRSAARAGAAAPPAVPRAFMDESLRACAVRLRSAHGVSAASHLRRARASPRPRRARRRGAGRPAPASSGTSSARSPCTGCPPAATSATPGLRPRGPGRRRATRACAALRARPRARPAPPPPDPLDDAGVARLRRATRRGRR